MNPSEELFKLISEDTSVLSSCSNLELTFTGTHVPEHLLSSSFEDFKLNEELKKTIYSLYIEKPSKVQSACFSLIQNNKNVVFQAPAGTGKTLGFVVATLNKVVDFHNLEIVVLCPTKELCQQVSDVYSVFLSKLRGVCLNLCSSSNNSVDRILKTADKERVNETCSEKSNTNDTNQTDNLNQTNDNIQIHSQKDTPCVVVGTPAAVLRQNAQKKIDITQAKMLVIDEGDRIASSFFTDLLRISKLMLHAQKIFFSASFSKESQDIINKLIGEKSENTVHALGMPKTTEEILFYNIQSLKKEKARVLKDLLTLLSASQVIVFCKQKTTVDSLKNELTNEDFPVTKIHGGLTSEERENAVRSFKQVESKILIATDLFGRGMDIPLVNLVINYDLPIVHESQTPDFDSYQHRVGRTARFGRKGFVIDFISDENDFNTIATFCKHFGLTQATIDIESLQKAFLESI